MKAFVLVSVALAALAFSSAEDDGKYRPQAYGGDDGRYRGSDEGRYLAAKYAHFPYNPYRSGLVYQPVVPRVYQPVVPQVYQPVYQPYQTQFLKNYVPNQQFVTPYVSYGDYNSIDQASFAAASAVNAVTYRPALAFPSASAVAYSSTPRPVLAPARPIVYSSTPRPVLAPLYASKNYGDRYAEKSASIVRLDNEITDNSYHYLYQTDNGIAAEESGVVEPNVNGGGTRARGFYEYIGDDGQKYRVDYTADENGFRPTGAHLPKK
ncbi:hypothetical protein JYU34_016421 [Plutella xylostella]|uniref:Cuticular protein n=1 Tax=Plutella xylostella TaxID=51655 RepID=A0ABQ7Q2R7_PLUXY|nr:hypothetical protein JYU34_016421 [Plutella xylostella]